MTNEMKEYIAAAKRLLKLEKIIDCSNKDYRAAEIDVTAAYELLDADCKELIDVSTYAVVRELVE